MTLIVALGCSDGAILASDSASTNVEAKVKQKIDKIKSWLQAKMLSGGSGDHGLIQKINDELKKVHTKRSVIDFRKELVSKINPLQKAAIENYVHIPGEEPKPANAAVLFSAIVGNSPQIIEIDKNGTDTSYDKELGSFHAIGSGDTYAHTLIKSFRDVPRKIEEGKFLAYRILEDAIDIAHFGLSLPIHISAIYLDGKIVAVDKAEMLALRDSCNTWRELEVELFKDAVTPKKPSREMPPPSPSPK